MNGTALSQILDAASRHVRSWPEWMQRPEHRWRGPAGNTIPEKKERAVPTVPTTKEAAEHLLEMLQRVTKAYSKIYDAIASDPRHRKIARASTMVRVGNDLCGLDKSASDSVRKIFELETKLLSLLWLESKPPTAKDCREAITHVLKIEAVLEVKAPEGIPWFDYSTAEDAVWDPFRASVSNLIMEHGLTKTGKAVTFWGLRHIVASLRSEWTQARITRATELHKVNELIAGVRS